MKNILFLFLLSFTTYAIELTFTTNEVSVGKPVWGEIKYEKGKIYDEVNQKYVSSIEDLNNIFLSNLYINKIENGRALVVFTKSIGRVTEVKDSINDYTVKINVDVASYHGEQSKNIQILDQDFKPNTETPLFLFVLLSMLLLGSYPLIKLISRKKKKDKEQKQNIARINKLKQSILKASKRVEIEEIVHLVSKDREFNSFKTYQNLQKYLTKIEFKRDWNDFEKNELMSLMEKYKNDIRK